MPKKRPTISVSFDKKCDQNERLAFAYYAAEAASFIGMIEDGILEVRHGDYDDGVSWDAHFLDLRGRRYFLQHIKILARLARKASKGAKIPTSGEPK